MPSLTWQQIQFVLTVLCGSCAVVMMVIALFTLCIFYAQRCFYKEVQTYNDKFQYDLKTYLEAMTC